MARKKKQKIRWLRILLLFIFVPLFVWSAAFVIWFYWYDINGWLKPDRAQRTQPRATVQGERSGTREPASAKRPRERILDEDRKKLEDILRRRN
jgi:hypothetical protein